jgi:predicted phage tail protein
MTDAPKHENYIDIMVESLQKKSRVLDGLIDKCDAQAEVIADNEYGDINWNQFNLLIADKEVMITRLNELDDGFEALYDRVGDEVKNNSERYAVQIKKIQELIKEVTDKGVMIRSKEEKNRMNLERVLRPIKKEIKTSKRSMSVINKYYNTMNGAGLNNSPGWVDRKK